MRIERLAWILAAAMLAAMPAGAQTIVGVVRDAGSSEPLAGALVVALDSSGHALARTLSNELGRFSLPRAPAASLLRVTRIGYTPERRALGTPNGDTLVVALEHIATMLGAVEVSGNASCAGSGSAAALSLWEQARAGLEAMIVARESRPAQAFSMTYSRIINAADSAVVEQTTRVREGTATRPFRARVDPAGFAQAGYVEHTAGGSRLYSAPDADVLLDPTFAASHCFSIVGDQSRGRPRVGLAFRPSNRDATIADVSGTLWFVAQPLNLDELVFEYVEPRGSDDSLSAGGRLVFRAMPNGVSFIRAWSIRSPATAVEEPVRPDGIEGATVRRIGGGGPVVRRLRVTQWRESGGRVLSASWPDGARSVDTLGSVAGVVEWRDTDRPASRFPVVLRPTNDTVLTDSLGRFQFDQLLPGKYALVAHDSTFSEFTEEPETTAPVVVHDGARGVAVLLVTSSDAALSRLCPELKSARPRSILLGRIVAPHVDPAWQIGASWQDNYDVLTSGINISAATRTIRPDSAGRYYVCGVVRERPVHLNVWLGKARLLDTAVVVNDSLVKRVDLVMPRGANRP